MIMDRAGLTRHALERARTVLANMAKEQDRKWWQFWRSRWEISDEPLRGDAKSLIGIIDMALR